MTMTTVGYGDITPSTSSERLYTIFSMIVACGVFAWIMGSIGYFVRRGDVIIQEFKEEINKINQFMIVHNLPKKFR
jgi:Ion channel